MIAEMKQIIYRICMCVMVSTCFVTAGCKDNFEDLEREYHAIDVEYSDMPLRLVSTIWAIDGTGGRFHCTINADEHVSWQITELPSWLTFSQTRGTGSAEITYSVTENPSTSTERAAYFTLESTSKEHSIKIPYYARQYVQQETFAVDLGLSVKWASCNVGAVEPDEYGKYYAWGETEEKSDYSWKTYKWCNGDSYSITKYNSTDDKETLDLEDDVAHVMWGGKWRMPTKNEWEELRKKCSWKQTIQNGHDGYKVIGPNGNSIFLPATGYRRYTYTSSPIFDGYYWSATLYPHDKENEYAYEFYFYNKSLFITNRIRCEGIPVRPVTD